jgi:hypothetical protein
MRVRPVVLLVTLLAIPCVSFCGVVEQNLQYSSRAQSDSHADGDCRNWTAPVVQWRKDGLSIDAARLALTLAANAAASHSAAYSVPSAQSFGERDVNISCDSHHNFE